MIGSIEKGQRHDHPSTEIFWRGFNDDGGPSMAGLKVLEIGCGAGRRCIEATERGASKVIGFDPIDKSIETAKRTLEPQYPDLKGKVEFRCCYIEDIQEENFDVILSEDAFEHIMDVRGTLVKIHAKLKEGGRAYIGFGPLYHSPYGDHGWIRRALPFITGLPWGHVLVPNSKLIKLLSRHYNVQIKNLVDWPFLSLNRLTVAEFRGLFNSSDLQVEVMRTNVAYSLVGKMFGLIGAIPLFEKYFTHNVFCVLRKL